MKQKIVIEVPLNCSKCKRKVMTICTTAEGVITSVKFLRDGRDRVEIIGEGVDASGVTQSLRDKVKYAHLVNVAKVEATS